MITKMMFRGRKIRTILPVLLSLVLLAEPVGTAVTVRAEEAGGSTISAPSEPEQDENGGGEQPGGAENSENVEPGTDGETDPGSGNNTEQNPGGEVQEPC